MTAWCSKTKQHTTQSEPSGEISKLQNSLRENKVKGGKAHSHASYSIFLKSNILHISLFPFQEAIKRSHQALGDVGNPKCLSVLQYRVFIAFTLSDFLAFIALGMSFKGPWLSNHCSAICQEVWESLLATAKQILKISNAFSALNLGFWAIKFR